MDIYAILAVAVAIITVASAYWLINGTPDFVSGSRSPRQRRP